MDFFNFLDDFWDVVGDDVLDRLKAVLVYTVNKLLDIFKELVLEVLRRLVSKSFR